MWTPASWLSADAGLSVASVCQLIGCINRVRSQFRMVLVHPVCRKLGIPQHELVRGLFEECREALRAVLFHDSFGHDEANVVEDSATKESNIVTRSPGCQSSTSSPTSSITPAASQPIEVGRDGFNGERPDRSVISVRLIPKARMFNRTSPRPGAPTTTSSMRNTSGPPN